MAPIAPIIPQDVATALAQKPMRRLETTNLDVYYPTDHHDEAVRFADHVEWCARQLRARALVHNGIADRRLTLIMPDLTFNNAFTVPMVDGYEPFAVVPTYQTIDAFSLEMGLPPDAGTIACHELTHYVHFNQVAGFSWFVDQVFGEAYTPQLGFDGWFDEGLAVYYETTLQPGVGRLAWPFWHGAFAAGVAGRRLHGGDLSEFNRDAFMGNHYLVGSHFVRFLAERYGEWDLWKTIEVQARSDPLSRSSSTSGSGRGSASRWRRWSLSSPTTPPRAIRQRPGRPSSGRSRRSARSPATGARPTAARR